MRKGAAAESQRAGRIVQRGRYAELLEQDGLFAELAKRLLL